MVQISEENESLLVSWSGTFRYPKIWNIRKRFCFIYYTMSRTWDIVLKEEEDEQLFPIIKLVFREDGKT